MSCLCVILMLFHPPKWIQTQLLMLIHWDITLDPIYWSFNLIFQLCFYDLESKSIMTHVSAFYPLIYLFSPFHTPYLRGRIVLLSWFFYCIFHGVFKDSWKLGQYSQHSILNRICRIFCRSVDGTQACYGNQVPHYRTPHPAPVFSCVSVLTVPSSFPILLTSVSSFSPPLKSDYESESCLFYFYWNFKAAVIEVTFGLYFISFISLLWNFPSYSLGNYCLPCFLSTSERKLISFVFNCLYFLKLNKTFFPLGFLLGVLKNFERPIL